MSMKHRSQFYTTDSAKSKRLSLKFFSFIIAALMCFSAYEAAIPAYAATSYEAVYITVDMLVAMYVAGDLTLTATVTNTSNTSSRYQYWDIINETSQYLSPGQSLTFLYPQLTRYSDSQIIIWYPYNLYANYPVYSEIYYSLELPFGYYGTSDSVLTLSTLLPGKTIDRVSASLTLFDDDLSIISQQSATSTQQGFLPSNNPLYDDLMALDPNYEFVADFMYGTFSFNLNSNNTLINKVSFISTIDTHGVSLTNSDVVPGLAISSFTLYVPGTPIDPDDPDSPTYAAVVQEYLSAIVDIDNQTQLEIDVLKAKLNAVDLDLNDISDQLVVDKPDISNGVSSIDTALLNGSEMFVTQSMTPILNQGIIVILFTGIFAIVSLKLVLFGSGKS